ncbi:MAG: S41 family peptidase [Candidatus Cyclonatronum sp.]|uniref:S41 family peptidase n=1 Tax=Cyclonatronum sp. TaxID=3024185 RepID=UPI0025BD325E|nr:S41 family peptidase [Cyclonatronum sp.]MCC5932830.1 S41 family peptidase [Balneolales bacterium]MCH8485620.1 S41 family peptidase [Cyclonatronum sp.]
MMLSKPKKAAILVIAAVLFAGFATASDTFFQIRKNFAIFSEVIQEVNELYVVEVDPERTIRRGINAMLETLDPYTVLIDESQTQDIDLISTGSYAGIGIEVGARGGELVIIAPVEGYSAHRKGVRAGDVIVSVNGIPASELTPDDLTLQMRGQIGSTVDLVVRRFGIADELSFTLERERIEVRNIDWYGMADEQAGIAYIMLSRFGQNAGSEMRRAIEEMEQSHTINSLILDLRNNPGGLLIEAVRVADLFLPAGEPVVHTRGRAAQTRQLYSTSNPSFFGDRPVVVLQNGGSASSSEIVSGALQDHDRAVIMGERSFGKGLVQIIRPISYGLALKITTSKYFIPSGRYIQSVDYNGEADAGLPQHFETAGGRRVVQRTGIEPDIVLEKPAETMLEVELHRGSHYFYFANQFMADDPQMPVPGVNDEALIQAFRDYLSNAAFSYTTRAQRRLTDLRDQLIQDYGDAAGPFAGTLEDLESDLEQLRLKEIDEVRDTILREIYLELSARIEGSNMRKQTSVSLDALVSEAIALLGEPEQYAQILSAP